MVSYSSTYYIDNKNYNKIRKNNREQRIKKRNISIAILMIITLSLIFSITTVFSSVNADNSNNVNSVYTVKNRDTLWDIACDLTTTNKDVRETVYEIKKLNHLTNDESITPGQKLILPNYYR